MSTTLTPLISETQIRDRIAVLGRQISKDYLGKDLTLLVLLKGGAIFFADLIRQITIPTQVEFLSVSSYRGKQERGRIQFQDAPLPNVSGRHVLIIDDIWDSGATLSALTKKLLSESSAMAIQSCVLLRKRVDTSHVLSVAYIGFDIPPLFVVGYGMDYGEGYRNLPYVAVLQISHHSD